MFHTKWWHLAAVALACVAPAQGEYAKVCEVSASLSLENCSTITENQVVTLDPVNGTPRILVCGEDNPILSRIPAISSTGNYLAVGTLDGGALYCNVAPYPVTRRGNVVVQKLLTRNARRFTNLLDYGQYTIPIGFGCGASGCADGDGDWYIVQQQLFAMSGSFEFRIEVGYITYFSPVDVFTTGCPENYQVAGMSCASADCTVADKYSCADFCPAGYRYNGCTRKICDTDVTRCPLNNRKTDDTVCAAPFQCISCFDGFTGDLCDQCLEGYFGNAVDGCIPCTCSYENSNSGKCTNKGTCEGECKEGYIGLDCNYDVTMKPTHAPTSAPSSSPPTPATLEPTSAPEPNITQPEAQVAPPLPSQVVAPAVVSLVASIFMGGALFFVARRRSRLLQHARMMEVDGDGLDPVPRAEAVEADPGNDSGVPIAQSTD